MPRRIKSQQASTPSEIPPALQLTENFPVGACVFYRDPQDNGPRFSFFSNRLLEMLDITRGELDADPMAAYRNLHPDDIGPFFEAAEEAARLKAHFINESRYIIRGATRWYRLEAAARQLPDGLTVWDRAVIDVTERRQAEEEAKTALHLTENIPVGTFVLLSPHQGPQRYTFLSKRWLEMTGLDPVKLKEDISHYFSIVPPEDREEAIAHNIAGAAALKPYKWEGRWLSDGKVTWVSIESVPVRRFQRGSPAQNEQIQRLGPRALYSPHHDGKPRWQTGSGPIPARRGGVSDGFPLAERRGEGALRLSLGTPRPGSHFRGEATHTNKGVAARL